MPATSGSPRAFVSRRRLRTRSSGAPTDALRELGEALAIAERLNNAGMLARIHRALMQLHMFIGRAAEARAHGERAIGYAGASGERAVEWSAHWGIAVLAGLYRATRTSSRATCVRRTRIAEELGSPVLAAWTSEVSIEYASGIGDWHSGLALAERTIPIARAVGTQTLLPRLLVWTGLMHLGRGELDDGRVAVRGELDAVGRRRRAAAAASTFTRRSRRTSAWRRTRSRRAIANARSSSARLASRSPTSPATSPGPFTG